MHDFKWSLICDCPVYMKYETHSANHCPILVTVLHVKICSAHFIFRGVWWKKDTIQTIVSSIPAECLHVWQCISKLVQKHVNGVF